MEKTLKLVGRTSNEIFILRYPSSLLDFCAYDLSYFAKNAVDACSEAQKTGKADPEVFAQLRRDIQSAHCYIEHNIRTTYEKVAIDCFIDFLCRRDNVGTGALWNRYISCKTPFEKAVFARLCDFRYNRAINEWLNIVRIQDYAKSKVDFIFTKNIKNNTEAASRRNYFDLMFSVTAREMGCKLEDLGAVKVFSVGRIPTSPFMFSNISKDIVRHVLSDFDYSDDYSDIEDYSEVSDQIAMDAFSRMKAGLPEQLSSYNIVRGKMENYPDKIYMPCSLKAVIDLEIDSIIDGGSILAHCKRCGRLYLRNEEYDEDYCKTYLQNGKSCLEIYREEHPAPVIPPRLEQKSREVTNEVYSRVGKTMSTKEYESWYSYMNAMKAKVASGEITAAELDEFLNYSLEVDISRSKPIMEVNKIERPTREKVVKPFVPERISRSEIKQPEPEAESDDEAEQEEARKDGFFVSPTVARQKNERQQISHIIRGGEPRGENNYSRDAARGEFMPFSSAGREPNAYEEPRKPSAEAPAERFEQKFERYEQYEPESSAKPDTFRPFKTKPESVFEEDYPAPEKPKAPRSKAKTIAELDEANVSSRENAEKAREMPEKKAPEAAEAAEKPEEAEIKPRKKVIRKNAAAISAYGKIAGAPVSAQPPEMEVVLPPPAENEAAESAKEKPAEPAPREDFQYPDSEPFKDIESIFDVLEQSENDMSGKPRLTDEDFADEPAPEWASGEKPKKSSRRKKQQPREEYPREVTRENAPSGIWTEERNLFGSEAAQSELDMLKEKKQSSKSNKTQRLYDVIMREPDDNPNFRRKG